ncbi:MAG: chemotaxis protein CheX [Candidatus Aureabacteria bacterium]|nr:chemotaxis protein CheX [Candidatus Auribacterota bacterium]
MSKILIIEPELELCHENLRQLLQAGFKQVYYKVTGEEGLDFCKKEKPDLIILNMSLPDYFGMEIPEIIISDSNTYGTPLFILLWDSFFVLEEPSVLKRKYRVMQTIKKPYTPINIIKPVQQALKPNVSSSATTLSHDLPIEYIQLFIENVEMFFRNMTEITPKTGQIFFDNDPFSHKDISAKMDITGDMEGTIALSFDKAMAYEVVYDMLKEEAAFEENFKVTDTDIKDGIGEIVNIITGNTKKAFSEKGYSFNIGLPKVFSGKQFTHRLAPRVPCILVPFMTQAGTLFIEVCLQVNENPIIESAAEPSINEKPVPQPDINEIKADIKKEPPHPIPAKEHTIGHDLTQYDVEKIKLEIDNKKAEEKQAPNKQALTPGSTFSQADIEKLKAEVNKKDTDQKQLVNKQAHIATTIQPDINEIRAIIDEQTPLPESTLTQDDMKKPKIDANKIEPTEKQTPNKQALTPGSTFSQADIEKLKAEVNKKDTDQKQLVNEQAYNDEKPKIILSKAPLLKNTSDVNIKENNTPKINTLTKPVINIEPIKKEEMRD